MKYLVLLVTALCFGTLLQAQVTGGKYKIEYNSTNCNYDIFLIPDAGSSASTTATLAPRTSRVTIVLPHGSNIFTTANQIPNEPHDPNSGDGVPWTRHDYYGKLLGTGTPGLPGYDVVAYDVDPNGTIYYPITTTTPILLFSLNISLPAGTVCGAGVRLWNNNSSNGNTTPNDPTSANIGNFTDYNNSFKIGDNANGGQLEKFTGKVGGNVTLPAPVITSFLLTSTTTTVTGAVTATAGGCANALGNTYAWTGPGAYSTPGVTVAGVTNTFTRPAFVAGTYAVTVTNSNGCTVTQSASVGVALPIKVVYFKGAADKCAAQLSWQIGAGEKDFQRFEVQYSTDGSRFATVGQVDRNAYNDTYSFSYTQASGKGYYRLKILDLSGKPSYSSIVDVTTDCDGPAITIAPNPTSGLATVSGIEAGDQVKVTDMLGNVIANYVSGGAKATIDLEVFPAGTYSVIISRNTEVIKAEKITKM